MAKLEIELIPKTCHYSNVRSMIKASQWDKLRKASYANAGGVCEMCGEKGKDQGFKHDLECHEIWGYVWKTKVQKLIGLVSLCPICHLVKHIGRGSAMGKQGLCFRKMEQVNGWDHKQVVTHMAESYELYKKRSKFPWTLDISILTKEPFNLELELDKKRVFVKSKYKKKRRKYKAKRPKKS